MSAARWFKVARKAMGVAFAFTVYLLVAVFTVAGLRELFPNLYEAHRDIFVILVTVVGVAILIFIATHPASFRLDRWFTSDDHDSD